MADWRGWLLTLACGHHKFAPGGGQEWDRLGAADDCIVCPPSPVTYALQRRHVVGAEQMELPREPEAL